VVVYLFWMLLCKFYNIVKCNVFDGVFCVICSVNGDGVFVWINIERMGMSIDNNWMLVCINTNCMCMCIGIYGCIG